MKTANAMKAIDKFRFTSPDEVAIRQIAAVYGGNPRPWSDPKVPAGQYEVITESSEIHVVLPPGCLGNSPQYERWSGGGCDRRCDGVTCTVIVGGPDGPEPSDKPCICDEAGAMGCEPHTRLNVILPDVRFTGVWRLESKSWNVAHEFPGFVDLICSLQERGLTRGVLRLEHRTSVSGGKTRKFVVPVLGVDESMDALAAGAASVHGLGASSTAPALGAGSSEGAPHPIGAEEPVPTHTAPGHAPSDTTDDEVIDAELVEDVVRPCARCGQTLVGADLEATDNGYAHKGGCPKAAGPRDLGDLDILKLAEKVFAPAKEAAPRGRKSKVVDECRHALAEAVTEGRSSSLKTMTAEEKHKLWSELSLLDSGFNSWRITVGGPVEGEALVLTREDREVVIPFSDPEAVPA